MDNRWSTLLSAAALVGLAVAVVALVMLWSRPQTIAAQQTTSSIRQITVIGTGEARSAPDTATVQLGVQTEAATARQALTDNTTQVQALIAKLKELGIADRDLQTSNINIYPSYNDDGRTIRGYQVNNTLTVTIRNIGQAGSLLDQVVDTGANSIGGLSFTVSDPSALEQQARERAIENARTRAEAMAQATGASIGQILSITENIGTPPQPMFGADMARAEAADSVVPIQSGEQAITAQVQITFELR